MKALLHFSACALLCLLVACGGNSHNNLPVAMADAMMAYGRGDTVIWLLGAQSHDADGDPLQYRWSLTGVPAGSKATIDDPGVVLASVTADMAGTYVATLVVNDGQADSAPAVASIYVTAEDRPVADPGPDQHVLAGALVTLLPRAPIDDHWTYGWTLIAKPTGSLASVEPALGTRTRLLTDQPGTYTVSHVIYTGGRNSFPATVDIVATASSGQLEPLPAGAGVFMQSTERLAFQRLIDNSLADGWLEPQLPSCIEFSAVDAGPDGTVLGVSTAEARVIEVDVRTGLCRTKFAVPEPMFAIAVAADGRIVTASNAVGQPCLLYTFSSTGEQINKVQVWGTWSRFGEPHPYGCPLGLDFAPDGRLIAFDFLIMSLDLASGHAEFLGRSQAYLNAPGCQPTGDIDIDAEGVVSYIVTYARGYPQEVSALCSAPFQPGPQSGLVLGGPVLGSAIVKR